MSIDQNRSDVVNITFVSNCSPGQFSVLCAILKYGDTAIFLTAYSVSYITQQMSNKGNKLTLATKMAIGTANEKDRGKINKLVLDYISRLKKGSFPTLTDCAIYAGISERTLIRYENETPQGSIIRQALDKIRDLEKSALIHGGLKRKYDGKLVALLLKANHGLREEPKAENPSSIFAVPAEILAEAISISRRSKEIKGESV